MNTETMNEAKHLLHVLQTISELSSDAKHAAIEGEPYEVLCKRIKVLDDNTKDFVNLLRNKEYVLQCALDQAQAKYCIAS